MTASGSSAGCADDDADNNKCVVAPRRLGFGGKEAKLVAADERLSIITPRCGCSR